MDDVDRIHVHAEATKIAYHIRDALVADPVFAKTPVDGLLDASYIDKLEAMIDMNKAAQPAASDFPDHPHTIYLAVVDRNGMAVSMINSIFDDFGAGISTPEYGVLFHSRGKGVPAYRRASQYDRGRQTADAYDHSRYDLPR